ncbi:hypothetical protein KM031_02055 [Gemmobacter fulvus]|uniref:Uncharacterized protein n=1 Tax=Gemmobacter fulvus TaxID=2840474 RepID=A0A975P6T7_9RHOB|nr:hypothetical protein [Gemmobacter fulvus]MBT9244927.1 hypothetical protein [Gemmobacter fulvus]QWK90719.1 hypothetical protein KM031_02055 [Gemmobacter fulvus]
MTMTKKTFENAVSAVLAGADPDQDADQVLTEAATPTEKVEATPEPKAEKKETIGSVVAELVMDVTLSYDMIVNLIHAQFDNASTSARSVASIAARLRKTGVDVPHRRKAKAAE